MKSQQKKYIFLISIIALGFILANSNYQFQIERVEAGTWETIDSFDREDPSTYDFWDNEDDTIIFPDSQQTFVTAALGDNWVDFTQSEIYGTVTNDPPAGMGDSTPLTYSNLAEGSYLAYTYPTLDNEDFTSFPDAGWSEALFDYVSSGGQSGAYADVDFTAAYQTAYLTTPTISTTSYVGTRFRFYYRQQNMGDGGSYARLYVYAPSATIVWTAPAGTQTSWTYVLDDNALTDANWYAKFYVYAGSTATVGFELDTVTYYGKLANTYWRFQAVFGFSSVDYSYHKVTLYVGFTSSGSDDYDFYLETGDTTPDYLVADNKLSSFSVDVSAYISGASVYLDIRDDYRSGDTVQTTVSFYYCYLKIENTAPVNDQTPICTNLDDGDNLYARNKIYNFSCSATDVDAWPISILDLTCLNGATPVWTVRYSSGSFSETYGASLIELTGSVYTSVAGSLDVWFGVRFEWPHPDASNYDLRQYCLDVNGASDTDDYTLIDYDYETRLDWSSIPTASDGSGTINRGDINGAFDMTGTLKYYGSALVPPDTEVDVWVSCAAVSSSPWSDLLGSSGTYVVTCAGDNTAGSDNFIMKPVKNEGGSGGVSLYFTTDLYDDYISDYVEIYTIDAIDDHIAISTDTTLQYYMRYAYLSQAGVVGSFTTDTTADTLVYQSGNLWYATINEALGSYVFDGLTLCSETQHGLTVSVLSGAQETIVFDRVRALAIQRSDDRCNYGTAQWIQVQFDYESAAYGYVATWSTYPTITGPNGVITLNQDIGSGWWRGSTGTYSSVARFDYNTNTLNDFIDVDSILARTKGAYTDYTIWDRIEIIYFVASDYRLNIGTSCEIRAKAQLAYDSHILNSVSDSITMNTSLSMTWDSVNLWWDYTTSAYATVDARCFNITASTEATYGISEWIWHTGVNPSVNGNYLTTSVEDPWELQTFTVEHWFMSKNLRDSDVYPEGAYSSQVAWRNYGGSTNGGFLLPYRNANDNTGLFRWYAIYNNTASGQSNTYKNTYHDENVWYHGVYSVNSTGYCWVYINGVLTFEWQAPNFQEWCYINPTNGYIAGDYGYDYNIHVDEVRFHNVVFDADRAYEAYHGIHTTAGLISYWPLDGEFTDHHGSYDCTVAGAGDPISHGEPVSVVWDSYVISYSLDEAREDIGSALRVTASISYAFDEWAISGLTTTWSPAGSPIDVGDGTYYNDYTKNYVYRQDTYISTISGSAFGITAIGIWDWDGGNADYLYNSAVSESGVTAFTYTFWLRSSDNVYAGSVISCSDGIDHNEILLLGYNNFQPYIAGSGYGATGIDATDGTWNHWAWQWRSSDGIHKIYKNGVLVWTSNAHQQSVTLLIENIVIGQDQDSFGGTFDASQAVDGEMADIRLYLTYLDAYAIYAIFQGYYGYDSSLLMAWDLGSTSVGEALVDDQSANNHDATIYGMTTIAKTSNLRAWPIWDALAFDIHIDNDRYDLSTEPVTITCKAIYAYDGTTFTDAGGSTLTFEVFGAAAYSGGVWTDSGPNGYIAQGSYWVNAYTDGIYGLTKITSAFYFAGTDDRLEMPHDSSQTAISDMTIEGWFYPTSSVESKVIIAKAYGASRQFMVWWLSTSQISFVYKNATYFNIGCSPTGLALSTWHHFVITIDGSTNLNSWYDGIHYLTDYTMAETLIQRDVDILIGCREYAAADYTQDFIGYISHLRMYSRALTDDECYAHYQRHYESDANLVFALTGSGLRGSAGTYGEWIDSTANNNDATAYSGAAMFQNSGGDKKIRPIWDTISWEIWVDSGRVNASVDTVRVWFDAVYAFDGTAFEGSVTIEGNAMIPSGGAWYYDIPAQSVGRYTWNTIDITDSRFGLNDEHAGTYFDGINDYATIVDSAALNTNQDYSVSVWFYYSGDGAAGKIYWTIASKNEVGQGYLDSWHFYVQQTTHYLKCRVGGGLATQSYDLSSGIDVFDSNWHMATLTYDHSERQFKLFLDGYLKTTYDAAWDCVDNADVIRLGCWNGYGDYYKGYITEILHWSRTLPDTEVFLLYAGQYNTTNLEMRIDGLSFQYKETYEMADRIASHDLNFIGLRIYDLASAESALPVWDELQVTGLYTNNTDPDLDEYVLLNVSMIHQFDSIEVNAGSFTLEGLSLSWNGVTSMWEVEDVRSAPAYITYNTVAGTASLYGISALDMNGWSVSVNWTSHNDHINITLTVSFGWTVISYNITIYYSGIYHPSGDPWSGTCQINSTASTFYPEYGTTGLRLFVPTSVTDPLYGITEFYAVQNVTGTWDTVICSSIDYSWEMYDLIQVQMLLDTGVFSWEINATSIGSGHDIDVYVNDSLQIDTTTNAGSEISNYYIGPFGQSWYHGHFVGNATTTFGARTFESTWWNEILSIPVEHTIHLASFDVDEYDDYIWFSWSTVWNNGTFVLWDNSTLIAYIEQDPGTYRLDKSGIFGWHNLTILLNCSDSGGHQSEQTKDFSVSDYWLWMNYHYTIVIRINDAVAYIHNTEEIQNVITIVCYDNITQFERSPSGVRLYLQLKSTSESYGGESPWTVIVYYYVIRTTQDNGLASWALDISMTSEICGKGFLYGAKVELFWSLDNSTWTIAQRFNALMNSDPNFAVSGVATENGIFIYSQVSWATATVTMIDADEFGWLDYDYVDAIYRFKYSWYEGNQQRHYFVWAPMYQDVFVYSHPDEYEVAYEVRVIDVLLDNYILHSVLKQLDIIPSIVIDDDFILVQATGLTYSGTINTAANVTIFEDDIAIGTANITEASAFSIWWDRSVGSGNVTAILMFENSDHVLNITIIYERIQTITATAAFIDNTEDEYNIITIVCYEDIASFDRASEGITVYLNITHYWVPFEYWNDPDYAEYGPYCEWSYYYRTATTTIGGFAYWSINSTFAETLCNAGPYVYSPYIELSWSLDNSTFTLSQYFTTNKDPIDATDVTPYTTGGYADADGMHIRMTWPTSQKTLDYQPIDEFDYLGDIIDLYVWEFTWQEGGWGYAWYATGFLGQEFSIPFDPSSEVNVTVSVIRALEDNIIWTVHEYFHVVEPYDAEYEMKLAFFDSADNWVPFETLECNLTYSGNTYFLTSANVLVPAETNLTLEVFNKWGVLLSNSTFNYTQYKPINLDLYELVIDNEADHLVRLDISYNGTYPNITIMLPRNFPRFLYLASANYTLIFTYYAPATEGTLVDYNELTGYYVTYEYELLGTGYLKYTGISMADIQANIDYTRLTTNNNIDDVDVNVLAIPFPPPVPQNVVTPEDFWIIVLGFSAVAALFAVFGHGIKGWQIAKKTKVFFQKPEDKSNDEAYRDEEMPQ